MSRIPFMCVCMSFVVSPEFGLAVNVSYYSITYGKMLTTGFGYRDAYSAIECGGYCGASTRQGTPCSAVTFYGGSRTCHLSGDDGSNVADVDDMETMTLILMQDTACSAASAPANGFISDDGFMATYSCAGGFTLNGDVSRICVFGAWTGAEPTCAEDTTCSAASAPANGFVADDGYMATYSCAGGWTLNGNGTRTCVFGAWTGAEPSCVSECGDISNLNVQVQDPGYCTQEGCSITLVGCATGFTLETDFTFPVTISCISTNWDTAPYVPTCDYELMFRGTADNGYNITAAYLYATDGATTDPTCMDVHDMSCTGHYRNPKIDTWESLGITRVKYEMYDAFGGTVMSVLINGTGSSLTNWFGNDVEVRAITMPWTEIVNGEVSWWSLLNDVSYGRSFRILKTYGGACTDYYYSVVLYEPNFGCNYENHVTWPKFLISNQPEQATNFNFGDYALASSLGVWVKY